MCYFLSGGQRALRFAIPWSLGLIPYLHSPGWGETWGQVGQRHWESLPGPGCQRKQPLGRAGHLLPGLVSSDTGLEPVGGVCIWSELPALRTLAYGVWPFLVCLALGQKIPSWDQA